MDMKVKNLLATLIGTGLIPIDALDSLTSKFESIIKKCLTCGKEHKHNNAFCSAECCKKRI